MSTTEQVTFTYKNHRGEVETRLVEPVQIKYTYNVWHPELQWMLEAYDVNRKALRTFAMKDISGWKPYAEVAEITIDEPPVWP